MKKVEDNDESVHILSHLPTRPAYCFEVWKREYDKIIERFANIVTGQFNGHAYKDGFHIYYNRSSPTKAVGVAFNGASITPYSNSSPSYKLYIVDQNTYVGTHDLLNYIYGD